MTIPEGARARTKKSGWPILAQGSKQALKAEVVSQSELFSAEQGDPMQPKDVVQAWLEAFNHADVDALVALYAEEAVNHQVAEAPVEGRAAIREMFETGFANADMVCIPENLFVDGEWAILEWRDPQGLRGCGFFHVENGKIAFQRGYWDKLSFLKLHGISET